MVLKNSFSRVQRTRYTASLRNLFILLVIIFLGAALRLHLWALDARFHPDEALFATFARHAVLSGDWFFLGALDKTPLSLYAQAFSMMFFTEGSTVSLLTLDNRIGELAARLPALLCGIALIPAVYGLAHALYRGERAQMRTAYLCAFLIAVSPLAIGFSGTAFTDMPMLLCVVLAWVFAAHGQFFGAGLGMALAFACKQQAIYALPVTIAILAVYSPPENLRAASVRWLRIGSPIVGMIALLILWDLLRVGNGSPSFWALAAANNSPGRFVRAEEWTPRGMGWVQLSGGLFGAPTSLLIVLGAGSAVSGLLFKYRHRAVWIDGLLLLFTIAYALLHWLVAFNTYDRYMLMLVIPAAILAARGLSHGWEWLARRLPSGETALAEGVLFVVLLGEAWAMRDGIPPYPIETSSFARVPNIDALAAAINEQPPGTILYNPWLGWELGYYLGEWTTVRRVFYPSPGALARDARAQIDPAPRLFVAPADERVGLWLAALESEEFVIEEIDAPDGFALYRLYPPED